MPQPKIRPKAGQQYRLITRSDMDGLVCAVLLREAGIIEDVSFAHPKDMQDGLVDVDSDVITTNLPYAEGVYMAFDHHASEIKRVKTPQDNHIIDPDAASAARVVYDYFGGAETFGDWADEMMKAVDKADSAAFTKEDIMDPKGWELLSFLMDSRTGLGRFRDFNISNYQLMMKLIEACLERKTIAEILDLPDVRERVDLFKSHQTKFREQIERCAAIHGNLVVLDLRQEDTIWAGNRFMVYALFPQCSISMHVMWGRNKKNTVMAVGKSILNKTSKTHIGNLMLDYGGGGHAAAGTCQIENLKADETIQALINKINADG